MRQAVAKVLLWVCASISACVANSSWARRPLRHSNFNLVLNKNDATSGFKADATFHKVAGLADGAWSSYKLYDFPNWYIRHANQALCMARHIHP
ncbi:MULTISPECIES: AbfB domain-containing protein [unclassified Janthinobacterium]|uniref:AbfB domain-containing protein n=1 Tax=unclassified Janthinobacterium TaxID=2610881 RepID=UPI0018DEEBC9|nr:MULTISPECIES: AbfB domain-containing protein [unclassified Janthinobacterium]MEC5159422.1 hypothetical protein [Janthinobacterium sp. CG_S6]